MSQPPQGYWTWVEYDATAQRGMQVAEPERKPIVDAKGRELRRAVGFVLPTSKEDDTMTLTDEERHVIEHSLGISHPRKRGQHPYRNHFCTGPETDDWPVLMSLVQKGLMFESRPPSDMSGGDHVFSVTAKGKEAVGCRP